jgi:hypothetical protein
LIPTPRHLLRDTALVGVAGVLLAAAWDPSLVPAVVVGVALSAGNLGLTALAARTFLGHRLGVLGLPLKLVVAVAMVLAAIRVYPAAGVVAGFLAFPAAVMLRAAVASARVQWGTR